MTPYSCDCCGRSCSRTHAVEACGMEGYACDICAGYEWWAYDEDPDPLLMEEDPKEREWEERHHWTNDHDRSEP